LSGCSVLRFLRDARRCFLRSSFANAFVFAIIELSNSIIG
jgi:hypothetical protein